MLLTNKRMIPGGLSEIPTIKAVINDRIPNAIVTKLFLCFLINFISITSYFIEWNSISSKPSNILIEKINYELNTPQFIYDQLIENSYSFKELSFSLIWSIFTSIIQMSKLAVLVLVNAILLPSGDQLALSL